jgi:hypothetical protein
VGCVLLAIGLGLYFAKQWGDGDAWLLGALGFLFSSQLVFGAETVMPFPLTLISNFLFVSLVYLIIYSIFLGVRNREVNRKYVERVKEVKNRLILFIALFFIVSWSFALFFASNTVIGYTGVTQMTTLPFLLTFILLFSYYAKGVEENLFKRKIKTSELKEGDVVLDGKWRGLTEKEIVEIRKNNKHVWVKEGVRFAPVFIMTTLISIFYGDLILILL